MVRTISRCTVGIINIETNWNPEISNNLHLINPPKMSLKVELCQCNHKMYVKDPTFPPPFIHYQKHKISQKKWKFISQYVGHLVTSNKQKIWSISRRLSDNLGEIESVTCSKLFSLQSYIYLSQFAPYKLKFLVCLACHILS